MNCTFQISSGPPGARKLIESQSKGSEAAMRQNAVNAGYAANDIEFAVLTPADYAVMRADLQRKEDAASVSRPPEAVPPIRLKGGTATAGTAPLILEPGTLLKTPELGALEYVDNGTTGHLYFTLKVAGVTTRVQIA